MIQISTFEKGVGSPGRSCKDSAFSRDLGYERGEKLGQYGDDGGRGGGRWGHDEMATCTLTSSPSVV